MEEKIKLQRIRMLSALGDFDLARSAAEFLLEARSDERYSVLELRRFRCFEHTAIMSYARPFSQSKQRVPKLSLKQCGVRLSDHERELHEEVIRLRNKLVAHSDIELMNFAAKAFDPDLRIDGRPYHVLHIQHDEGLQFHDFRKQHQLVGLIGKVNFGLYKVLLELSQSEPDAFDLKVHLPRWPSH